MNSPTNFLELRIFGLQRCGNHAIIEWILDQHLGKRTCFLNNVRHGDDPYTTAKDMVLAGFGLVSDVETVRSTPKDLLIYSYEDDLSRSQSGRTLLEHIDDEQFEENRTRYVGASQYRKNILILRDPFNFFASRLRKLNALTGCKDIEHIKQNWKLLARRALQMSTAGAPGDLFVNYNRWFTDERYRRQLSRTLLGKFSDASLDYVSGFGGGSSFDSPAYGQLNLRTIRRKWRRLLTPKVYLHPGRYLKKLFARRGRHMKVLERWRELRGDESYRRIFQDRELLELSERLFGELGGTRAFVKACNAEPDEPSVAPEADVSAQREA